LKIAGTFYPPLQAYRNFKSLGLKRLKSFYVDDYLCETNDENTAVSLVKDLCAMLAMGGFILPKWLSSSDKFMRTIPDE